MIKLVDLTKIYNTGESVGIGIQGINLELHVGEFVAIVGASGSGKTTLLNIISGMDTYTEGEMFINGVSTANFDTEELENYRRGNVAFIFQNYHLIDSYTVLENVMVELIIKGMPKKEAKEKALELLEKVGMEHRIHNRATKLSGGEKQRVVIARALASDAKILACDEPTGNLDEKNTKEIMSIIKEVASDKLVLFVTHDESIIEGNATRIVKIRDGRVESDTNITAVNKLDSEFNNPSKNDFSTKLYITSKNILRTPKKSFFVLLVFTIVSFLLLFSIAYVPLDVMATTTTTVEFDMFKNRDENRIVVYHKEGFDGNYNVDGVQIYKNDYLLEYDFRAAATFNKLNNYFFEKSKIIFNEEKLTLQAGRMPESNEEIVVILEEGFSNDFYDQILNNKTSLRFATDKSTGSFFGTFYKIVGFATMNEEEKDKEVSYFYITEEAVTTLYEDLKESIRIKKDSEFFESDFSLLYQGKYYPVEVNDRLPDGQIRIHFKYQNEEFKLMLGNKEINLDNYEHNYVYDTKETFDIQLSFDVAIKMIEDTDYRVSIICNDNNIDENIAILKENKYLTVFPLKEAKQEIPQYDYQSIFKNLFSLVFIFVEVVAAIFITSLITTLILGTKKKEIGILRVIGLNKNDVLHILNMEVVLIMVIAIIINLVAALALKHFSIPFDYTIIFNNVWKLLSTILILIVMAIYIAYRWNKTMFKLTAREVLRAGE